MTPFLLWIIALAQLSESIKHYLMSGFKVPVSPGALGPDLPFSEAGNHNTFSEDELLLHDIKKKELFTWKRIQPSLRGRTPEATSQTARTDCFVISILAMTLVLQADSLSKVLFRFQIRDFL